MLKETVEVNVYEEFSKLKNIIKKYFLCIYNYHAKEFINLIYRVKEEINYYCSDAPILFVTFFVKQNIYKPENLLSNNFIKLIKYEESGVKNKCTLFIDTEKIFKNFVEEIKKEINDLSYEIDNGKIKIFFDNFEGEETFEKMLKDAINEENPKYKDINDIIKAKNDSPNKIFVFDFSDVKNVLDNLK